MHRQGVFRAIEVVISLDDNAAVGLRVYRESLPGKDANTNIASDCSPEVGGVSGAILWEPCGDPFRPGDRGITVIVIDHNMRFMKGLCDRVMVMNQGHELATGAPLEVLANPKVIEAYLGRGHAADHRI